MKTDLKKFPNLSNMETNLAHFWAKPDIPDTTDVPAGDVAYSSAGLPVGIILMPTYATFAIIYFGLSAHPLVVRFAVI